MIRLGFVNVLYWEPKAIMLLSKFETAVLP